MILNNLIFLPIKREVLEKKNYLLQSLGFHLLIIMLVYYGLPNLFRYRAEFLPPLPVEIINISDKTAAPKINFKKTPDTSKNKTDEKVTPTKLGINLSISEVDAVRRHFEKCWNIPSGAREVGNLATEIKVRFNKEGNVLDARIANVGRMKRDRYFRTAAESALRAVLNPRCKNAPLPKDKFDKWKNLTLNFDPKSIIGY